jgi:hypothetical protein
MHDVKAIMFRYQECRCTHWNLYIRVLKNFKRRHYLHGVIKVCRMYGVAGEKIALGIRKKGKRMHRSEHQVHAHVGCPLGNSGKYQGNE